MRRHRLIPGAPLLGFADAFDGAYGDPETPEPYPRVAPSRVGPALLPFRCPHCGEVRSELVDPKKREHYHDARGFYWCPACRKRLELDLDGVPLSETLSAGATCARAQVTRNGDVSWTEGCRTSGFDLLGAMI